LQLLCQLLSVYLYQAPPWAPSSPADRSEVAIDVLPAMKYRD